MVEIQKIIPITRVKRDLLDIMKQIAEEDATVAVTKNGVPVGVMMTPGRYEALLETIGERLIDPLPNPAGDAHTGAPSASFRAASHL